MDVAAEQILFNLLFGSYIPALSQQVTSSPAKMYVTILPALISLCYCARAKTGLLPESSLSAELLFRASVLPLVNGRVMLHVCLGRL